MTASQTAIEGNRTRQIQKCIGKMQVLKFHTVAENVSQILNHEMDVMSVSKAGVMFEFEVKVSRGDFLCDKKKRKYTFFHPIVPTLTPNYFSYACPPNLIHAHEVQSYAGLYWVDENGLVEEIKNPRRLHKHKHSMEHIYKKLCRVYAERYFLGACRLTYENKLIKEKNLKIINEYPINFEP
jgi:hypothetical protein